MSPIEVTISTGRTLQQGIGSEKGKESDEYTNATGTLYMDPEDMKKLGVHLKDPVKLKTRNGEVILRANKSPDAPHKGIVFIPYGPWANKVIGTATDSQGMPNFKNIPGEVEKTSEKPVSLDNITSKEESE